MEYEIKPPGKFNLNLPELWTFRELIFYFTWRDIKVKYKQTFLGALWAVLQPILMIAVFSVFFSMGLKVDSGTIPYPVFVFSGLLYWNFFSAGLTNSGNSMVTNANIIKKIYFPRLIIPISSILSSLVDLIISLLLFALLLIYYNLYSSLLLFFLTLPFTLLLVGLTTFGLGSLLASLNIKYRDFRYIIPFAIQILFFLTPVIYSISIIPFPWLKQLLELNPIVPAIQITRDVITGNPIDWLLFLKGLTVSLLLLVTGIFYFRKTEYYFADLA